MKTGMLLLRSFCDNDILLMERWFALPHVAEWYKYPEHWLHEIRGRHGEFSFLTQFIVECDTVSIGFCQYYDCYFAKKHEIWNKEWRIVEQKGECYSIDCLIGETEYLRRGFGRIIIEQLIEKIWKLGAKKIFAEPEKENIASRKMLEAAGFKRYHDDYVMEYSDFQKRNSVL